MGVTVSKANLYGLLSPLPGANISKVNLYAVVGNPLPPVPPPLPLLLLCLQQGGR